MKTEQKSNNPNGFTTIQKTKVNSINLIESKFTLNVSRNKRG